MPIDSEARWRLVRKARGRQALAGEAGDGGAGASVNIRPVEVEDLPQLVEIYNYYVLNSVVTFDIEKTTLADWQGKLDYLTGLGLPFIVAEIAASHAAGRAQVLGFAYLAPWRQKAAYRRTVENSIYLRPAATGKRLGTKLLAELLERGKAAGLKEVVAVISDRGAEASISLHESFGFKRQGALAKVGFKFGRWLGVVLLQKSL